MPLPRSVELVNPHIRRGPFRVAVFDFDGTVSLIREGWSGIMADLGVELLDDPSRHAELELEMLKLSGKPSIYQMRKLTQVVTASGKSCPTPEQLLSEFTTRLFRITGDRQKGLADGTALPETWAVPGSHALLQNLQDRGTHLVLASGTPMEYVQHEAKLLELTRYFGDQIFAPEGNTPNFNKRDVIDQLVRQSHAPASEIIGFGDGYAETVEMKRVGGVAVGVASQPADVGGVNAMKRAMLIELGADLIVPDYADQDGLVSWLFGEE